MTTKEKFERGCCIIGVFAFVCSLSSAVALDIPTFVGSVLVFFAALMSAAISYECIND